MKNWSITGLYLLSLKLVRRSEFSIWRCCWGHIVCRDGFLAFRASGCAGLGNHHTGKGVVAYQSSFNFQLTLLSIFATYTPSHAHMKLLWCQSAVLARGVNTFETVLLPVGIKKSKRTASFARRANISMASRWCLDLSWSVLKTCNSSWLIVCYFIDCFQ